jgi:hypothetical protein
MTPEEMGRAIIRNLKKNKGKSLYEWLQVVAKSGLEQKKEVVAFLKDKQGLGHFQALKVYESFYERKE